jgi:hypothetical protein
MQLRSQAIAEQRKRIAKAGMVRKRWPTVSGSPANAAALVGSAVRERLSSLALFKTLLPADATTADVVDRVTKAMWRLGLHNHLVVLWCVGASQPCVVHSHSEHDIIVG